MHLRGIGRVHLVFYKLILFCRFLSYVPEAFYSLQEIHESLVSGKDLGCNCIYEIRRVYPFYFKFYHCLSMNANDLIIYLKINNFHS